MSDIYKRKDVPTAPVTVLNARAEEPGLGSRLDAQTVRSILSGAEAGDCTRLWTLYRDIVITDDHIQGELAKRKLALLGDPVSVQPWDAKNGSDKRAAELVEKEIIYHRDFFAACVHLLDGVLYPVALVEKTYRPGPGPTRYQLDRLIPVPARYLDYRLGELRIAEAEPDTGRLTGNTAEPDPNRYITHRGHLLTAPDQFGGPMRSLVWWFLFGAMDRHWWARFLDRYGAPFLLGKFQAGDENSRQILEAAFSYATRLGGLVVTDSTSVEIKEALRSDAGDAFEKFFTISRRQISKLILGQTLSAEAQATGLGSGVAAAHTAVRRDIRQYDGAALGRAIRDQLIAPWLLYNGIQANAPTITWSEDTTQEAGRTGELLAKLSTAGLEPDDEALYTLSERIGFGLQRKAAAQPVPFGAAPEVGASTFFRRERTQCRPASI